MRVRGRWVSAGAASEQRCSFLLLSLSSALMPTPVFLVCHISLARYMSLSLLPMMVMGITARRPLSENGMRGARSEEGNESEAGKVRWKGEEVGDGREGSERGERGERGEGEGARARRAREAKGGGRKGGRGTRGATAAAGRGAT